ELGIVPLPDLAHGRERSEGRSSESGNPPSLLVHAKHQRHRGFLLDGAAQLASLLWAAHVSLEEDHAKNTAPNHASNARLEARTRKPHHEHACAGLLESHSRCL